MVVKEIQLGKNGLTEGFMETLKSYFQKYRVIKVTVLKSARESKQDVKNLSLEILAKLGDNFTARVIGFKIVLKKWRRPKN